MTDTQPSVPTSDSISISRTLSSAARYRPELTPDWIDSHALGIVKALQKAGYTSFLVGGCVRDLLLGVVPKDYDIATMAHPPQVKRLIHMAFIIGKRFRLVLVKRGDQQFEVATFRKEFDPTEFPVEQYPDGPPSTENIFGSPEEDALRRDFTINALFYDPISTELIDYVGGRADIENRHLRMIGSPDVRLVEDPIRILRALRFAHKLRFVIDPALRDSMARHAELLKKSVLPRRREELLKLLRLPNPAEVLVECHDLGILREIFPSIEQMFSTPERQETFLRLLTTFRQTVLDTDDTGQMFGWLLSAMNETLAEESIQQQSQHQLEERTENQEGEIDSATYNEETLNAIMRDELGMYKFEQSLISDVLRLGRAFERTDEHRRKGERRQASIVRREGFPIALRIAIANLRLSADNAFFWLKLYESLHEEIEAAKRERHEKRRARPPRRRRPRHGTETEGDAETGEDIDDSSNGRENSGD